MRSIFSAAASAALCICSLPALAQSHAGAPKADDRPYPVMVGDPAPPLSVSRWIKRGPMDSVQSGKPYVVEFWATWCIPCIAGVPHLTQLQSKYAGKVTIIGANVWDADIAEVEQFINDQGDRLKYLVALDEVPPQPPSETNGKKWTYEHGRMSLSWLKGSGRTGIPVAFIVDAQGRIAWIGEPREMDEPLAQIVDGKWDQAAFTEKHCQRMTAQFKSEPIIERLDRAMRAHDAAAALAATDELIALGPTMAKYAGDKFEILLTQVKDAPRAYTYAREAITGVAKNDKGALNTIANVILKQKGPDRDLDVALAASLRAEQVTQSKNSRTLKTLAAVHAAREDFVKAVEVQQRALAAAFPEEKPEFQELLAAYQRKSSGR